MSKPVRNIAELPLEGWSRGELYAGGDIVTGGATVILAMGAGRTAAKAIHEKLMGTVIQ